LLIGRVETEYLEVKGSDTDIDGSGRGGLAKELAGMISASGGYVVIGTEPGEDRVSAYPGLDVQPDQIENLRRSLLDRVRPTPIGMRGPVALPADDGTKTVLAIQVFRHPAGLPASADGRYWLRSHDETRPMDYDEVRRRTEAAATGTGAAVLRSSEELKTVGRPIEAFYRDGLNRRGKPEVPYSPFRLAVVPQTGTRDLGLTGAELQISLKAAGDADAEAYERSSGETPYALVDLTQSAVVVDGLDFDSEVPRRRIRFHHDGVFAGAENIVFDPWDSGVSLDSKEVETMVVRFCGIALRLFQDTVGPTTLYVATESGIIPDAPSSIATHSFETPTSGPLAVDSVLKGARVLATRVSETAIAGSTHTSEAWLDDYADEVVAW
jgi:ribosomal protein S10